MKHVTELPSFHDLWPLLVEKDLKHWEEGGGGDTVGWKIMQT